LRQARVAEKASLAPLFSAERSFSGHQQALEQELAVKRVVSETFRAMEPAGEAAQAFFASPK
jgi:hypothetical protein